MTNKLLVVGIKQSDDDRIVNKLLVDADTFERAMFITHKDLMFNFETAKLIDTAFALHQIYAKDNSPTMLTMAFAVRSRKVVLSTITNVNSNAVKDKIDNKSVKIYRIYVYGDQYGAQHKMKMAKIKMSMSINWPKSKPMTLNTLIEDDDFCSNLSKVSGHYHAFKEVIDPHIWRKFIAKYV